MINDFLRLSAAGSDAALTSIYGHTGEPTGHFLRGVSTVLTFYWMKQLSIKPTWSSCEDAVL